MGQKHQPYYTMAFGVVSEVEQPQQYTSIMLHQLRPSLNMLSMSDSLRNFIAELGIKRRFRGHRGKKARINRTLDWKAKWSYNKQVHHHLLKSLPRETTYDRNSKSKFGVVNTRSIRNKSSEFLHYCIMEDLDFCAVTETWLTNEDALIINDLQSTTHSCFSIERKGGRGGGLGLLVKNNIKVKLGSADQYSSFESGLFNLTIGDFNLTLIVTYRPPYTPQHPVPVAVFLDEFSDFLSSVMLQNNRCLFVGDFNIHVNDMMDHDAASFNDLLNSFALCQVVTQSTHKSGNILDLLIHRENSDFDIQDIHSDFCISDHTFVMANISTLCPVPIHKQIQTRKLRSVDYDNFEDDILTAAEEIIKNDNLEDLIDNYDNKLANILEKHAPVVTKTVMVRGEVPWFNVKAKELKAKMRRAERIWSCSRTCENWNHFKEARNKYRYHLNHSKYQCINNQI